MDNNAQTDSYSLYLIFVITNIIAAEIYFTEKNKNGEIVLQWEHDGWHRW